MKILDFEGSATPVVLCDPEGRVLAKNTAAAKLRPSLRRGSILNVTPPLCRLPQGRCLVIPHEGMVWLLFCDFLRFDFDGAIFPTAREALLLSGTEMLKAIAEHSSLEKSRDKSRVTRLRDLLYERFSFFFSAPADPFKVHSTARLIKAFERILPSDAVRFTADGGSTRLINTRNAAILMTSLISVILPKAKTRIKADVRHVGDDLRLSINAVTRIPMDEGTGEALTDLYPYFSEHAADLFTADLCARTCGYATTYQTTEDGTLSIDIYVRTETDLFSILDPAEKIPFEEELAVLAKKLS